MALFILLVAFMTIVTAPAVGEEGSGGSAAEGFTPNGLVVLLTDFGDGGFYAGAMKGVVYSRFPDARVETITNQVPPFDVKAAAFTLYWAAREFPPGTVFLAVVDPGVGTARRPILLQTSDGKVFAGPDNGLFTLVADRLGQVETRVIASLGGEPLPAGISATFHGRDIFAPAAALAASGSSLASFGRPAGDLARISYVGSGETKGRLTGEVVLVDRYGNLITSLDASALRDRGVAPGCRLEVRVGDRMLKPLYARTYGDAAPGATVCLEGSGGWLELAVNQGDLAERLGVESGARVEVVLPGTAGR